MSNLSSPAFGEADLSNCERELIHLAGSIQPHGVLLAVSEPDLAIRQASQNAIAFLGVAADALLGRPLATLGGDIERQLRDLLGRHGSLADPRPFHCTPAAGRFEGRVHREPSGVVIVELEPLADHPAHGAELERRVADAVHRISGAATLTGLFDAVVETLRPIVGYDRVMVYRFDPDGHGEVIAEAREPRLESFLGQRYPATDIPQRARDLYIRNRVRVLVDVGYAPVPVLPRRSPLTGEELDMSLCELRSMSPLHVQYLKNMGVTATLVASLVREGRLWGLVACHHYSPRRVGYAVRTAAALLAEVVATRIAALEHYAQARAEVLVRRLEQRLIEATSIDGDWRMALFGNPRALLQPLDASGAALFYEGEVMTAGDVPATRELRALAEWVRATAPEPLFSTVSIGRANPDFAGLAATVSGVLSVELSRSRPDYLMWFRKEQVAKVTWAGDPAKPVIGNDPLELSPRRSFAAWSEIVRGTAAAWTRPEVALARAIGNTLRDIVLQIQAVRLLIAQHQLMKVRLTVDAAKDAVLIADPRGRILFANEAFAQLLRRPHRAHLEHLEELAALSADPLALREALERLRAERRAWRGEVALRAGDRVLPVALRADVVPGQDGQVLGYVVILLDLTHVKQAEAARRHLEDSLAEAGRAPVAGAGGPGGDAVVEAILSNASIAAMEIADAANDAAVAPLLEELEASARRAAALYGEMRSRNALE